MSDEPCAHVAEAGHPDPTTTEGCEECLEEDRVDWVELRVCRTCGHVGCCGSSPGRHAEEHFQETGHPVITPLEGDDWSWCYEHEAYA